MSPTEYFDDGVWKTVSPENALPTIEKEHAEIHEGAHFLAHAVGTIGSGTNFDLQMTTPATPIKRGIHAIFGVNASGIGTLSIYEAATSSTGTTVTPRNRLRTGGTSACAVVHTPTVTGTGTLLEQDTIGGGQGAFTIGGRTRGNAEWVLAPNTKYLARFTSGTAGNVVAVDIDYYEE